MNQSKKSNVIMPPSGTFTVDFTYLYKVKFFDIYKLFVKLTVIDYIISLLYFILDKSTFIVKKQ